jgi:hypothetical protein
VSLCQLKSIFLRALLNREKINKLRGLSGCGNGEILKLEEQKKWKRIFDGFNLQQKKESKPVRKLS